MPEFNSMTYHGKVAPDREEWVVKIFSNETISDEWLHKVFSGKVGWVLRKEVRVLKLCFQLLWHGR